MQQILKGVKKFFVFAGACAKLCFGLGSGRR
jgi:hypothetical protein